VAEETNETTEEVKPAEVTEDDLRALIGDVVEEKLGGLTDSIAGLADSVFDKIKGDSESSEASLMEKVGNMIDEKLKGVGTGTKENENGPVERVPKIRIFS